MSRTTHALRAVTALCATLAVGPALAPAVAAAPRPDVANIAHRGSSGAAPENTIAAVRLSLAQGADVVENDIQRTSDGELVILHDASLARTTDVEQVFPGRASYDVVHFTLAEVKRLDAGSWFAPQFAGERIPDPGGVGGRRRAARRDAHGGEAPRALPRDRAGHRQGAPVDG
jgi:glycerophosphoryl diester phosphodiesterase